MAYEPKDARVLETQFIKLDTDYNDVILKNIREALQQPNEDVQKYLKYGVGRRLKVIQLSARRIYELFPPSQVEALPKETINEVQIYLQAFVINVAGIFDNWAWAFVLRHGLLDDLKGGKFGVGMFVKPTQQRLPTSLRTYVTTTIKSWSETYIKDFRDALAHRIPLYVPPSRIDPKDLDAYKQMDVRKQELFEAQDWEELERVTDEQDGLGKAYPVFLNDFAKHVPFHPQLNADSATVIEFANKFYSCWHEFVPPQQGKP
jgi:hypothetical protein